jgi:hypothetical protein
MPSRLRAGDYEAEFGALEAEREAIAEFVGLASDEALEETVERHWESVSYRVLGSTGDYSDSYWSSSSELRISRSRSLGEPLDFLFEDAVVVPVVWI